MHSNDVYIKVQLRYQVIGNEVVDFDSLYIWYYLGLTATVFSGEGGRGRNLNSRPLALVT